MTNIQAIDLLKGLEQSLDDYCELNDEGKTAFHMAITALEVFGISEQLPSVQPEERTEERTETHACDCVSRQAAIDAVGGNEPVGDPSKMDDDDVVKMWERIRIINIINKLPSAQPEDCDTCKHGYFGDEQCNSCRVRFTSHYERRTDGEIIPE
jgi:hypothetical protein